MRHNAKTGARLCLSTDERTEILSATALPINSRIDQPVPVNFTLGIFELFTYAIPGAMQLTFFAYLAARLNLIELADVNAVPGLVLAVGAAIASYLLGHLTYIVSTMVDRLYPTSRDGMNAWAAVARDAAEAGERAVPRLNSMLLLAGAELRDRDVATEIGRLRATGLMLRSAVIPTALGTLVAIVEVITGPHRWLSLVWHYCCAQRRSVSPGTVTSYGTGPTPRPTRLRTGWTCP